MAVPVNIILIWGGTKASIPSGWTRETTLDSKFPKATANGVDPNVTGGSNSHSHTASTHTHTMISHTHSGDTNNSTNDAEDTSTDSTTNSARDAHHHYYSIAGVSGGSLSDAISYQSSAGNSLPPYYEVIYIKPDALPASVSDGIITLFNSATTPTGWTICDGSGTTPDLRGRYLRGAVAAGDAGATGGATTHSHTVDHTHASITHTHSGTSNSASDIVKADANGSQVGADHTHVVTLTANAGETGSNYTGTAGSADTVEPAYKKVIAIKNTSGGASQPRNIIGLWLGTLATIPAGWIVCDGTNGTPDLRDKWIKIATTTGEIGNTGGANTHTHAASNSHTHTASGTHTHAGYTDYHGNTLGTGMGPNHSSKSCNHTITTSGSATSSWNSATIAATSSSNEPEYVTAAYVMNYVTFQDNFVVGDIKRAGEKVANSAKGQITAWKHNQVKAYIPTYQKQYSSLANIRNVSFKKFYEYRVYSNTNAYITTWSKEVISEPKFKVVINGGPSELPINLARKFDNFGEDIDVKLNNRVDLWCFDRDAPNGIRIYQGFISGYKPILDGNKEYIEVTVLSYLYEASTIMLRETTGSTDYVQNSLDPSTIMKDVINRYRAENGFLSYSSSSVALTGTTVSYTFKSNMIKEAFDIIIQLTPEGWYWYVDPNGIIYMKAKPTTNTHTFRVGREIAYMETWRRLEDMVNRVYFVGGGTPQMFRVYENAGSIAAYGLKAYKYIDQRVTVTGTADIMANRMLLAKKDPEIRTIIDIYDNNGIDPNKGYNIESLTVGDTFEIRNLQQGVKTVTLWDVGKWGQDVWDQTLSYLATSSIQIVSIDYTPQRVRMEASSRIPQITKRIEDINRNAETTVLINNPSSPT